MPFPTVKSDPWKKGLRRRRRFLLWSADFWKKLVAQARRDFFRYGLRDVSPACAEMIAETNRLLYGPESS